MPSQSKNARRKARSVTKKSALEEESTPSLGEPSLGEADAGVTADQSSQQRAIATTAGRSTDAGPEVDAIERALAQCGLLSDDDDEELDALDDWSSAWKEAKATSRQWGGRAFGGRGTRLVTGGRKDIVVEGVTLAYKNQVLLNRTTLRFLHAHRYGLLGRNGVGKSTLARRIASGNLPGFPRDVSVLLVEQEAAGDDKSPVDAVIAGHKRLTQLLQLKGILERGEFDSVSSTEEWTPERLEQLLHSVYEELEFLEAATAEKRALDILKGLGFKKSHLAKTTKELSGGWRMRVALATTLFINPDFLILDEPTNHLDLKAVLWLEDYLQGIESTVLVISHDREFLNNTCTDIVVFRNAELSYFPGNLSDYEEQLENKTKHLASTQANLDKKRAHITQSIKNMQKSMVGNIKDEKRGGQVASRRKKLERLGLEKDEHGHRFKVQNTGVARIGSVNENALGWSKGGKMQARSLAMTRDPEIRFSFPSPEPLGSGTSILQVRNASFSYGDKCVFQDVTLNFELGDKVAIVGLNGSGKTTLLDLLAQKMKPTTGEVWVHHNARMAHFTQHHVDALDLSLSPLSYMKTLYPLEKEQELRSRLGSFGITASLALKPMSALSGGQKSRVSLTVLTMENPHILLLDEPTNHFDFDSVDALVDALLEYPGTVVVVSHSRTLLHSVPNLLKLQRGKCLRYEGDFDDYLSELM